MTDELLQQLVENGREQARQLEQHGRFLDRVARVLRARIDLPELLSLRQAARVLGIGRTKLGQLVDAGEIERVYQDGQPKIARASIERYIGGLPRIAPGASARRSRKSRGVRPPPARRSSGDEAARLTEMAKGLFTRERK